MHLFGSSLGGSSILGDVLDEKSWGLDSSRHRRLQFEAGSTLALLSPKLRSPKTIKHVESPFTERAFVVQPLKKVVQEVYLWKL